MSFSYDISVRVSKPLTTVTSDLYQLGFCTSASSTVAPPLLQIAVAGSGTAASDAVQAKCYTVGTNSVEIIANTPFGTNAAATYVYLRENSTNPAASVDILDGNPQFYFHDAIWRICALPTAHVFLRRNVCPEHAHVFHRITASRHSWRVIDVRVFISTGLQRQQAAAANL
jgi:hypothetical protein